MPRAPPEVTAILLAHNCEEVIGADDASTDGTYRLIKRRLDEYTGRTG